MRAKLVVAVLAIGTITSLGCANRARPGPQVYGYTVEKASADPVAIERAPRVWFRGAWAHWYDGRWHYPTTSGWMTFVEEPPELHRMRDSVGTEQPSPSPGPRGPSVQRNPEPSGVFALPPPDVE